MASVPSNQVANLLDLSADERRAYFQSFDLVLCDCDGTVWGPTGSIAGAGAGVTALQKSAAKPVVFVTNNGIRSDESYLETFERESIDATMADVMHPGIAICEYFRQHQFSGLIYVLGSANLRRYLLAAGHRLVDSEQKTTVAEGFGPFLAYVRDGQPVDAVVMDWDSNLEVKELLRAEAYLVARPECLFLVGATDEKLPYPQPMMGPGVFVRLMEEAVGRKALVLGKPGAEMVKVVMRKYAVQDPRRILIIGDT